MWFERTIPAPLQVPGIRLLRDIPLDATGAEFGVWCAYYESDLSFRDRQGSLHLRRHTYAGLSDDPDRARFFCMMEAAERVSGLSAQVMERLAFEGIDGRPWSDFSPYSARQWTWNAAYPDSSPRWWVRTYGLQSGIPVDVPADSVFPWWRSYFGRVSPLPEGEGGGFAAGFDWEAGGCAERGLREVIERDSVMLSWRLESWPARGLNVALVDPRLRTYAREAGLHLELYDVGDPGLAPVVVALLSREDTEAVLGASCGRELPAAADKAVREAFMLRGTAQLLDSDTPPLTPEDVLDSADHLVYAWRNSGEVLHWYRRKARRNAPCSGAGDALIARCQKVFGAEPLIVNVTDPRLASLRIQVVRVLQPHAFRKEYRHVYRYEGGERLRSLCVATEDLHTAPHPVG